MKFVGFRDEGRTLVGRVFADETVAAVAEVTEFYAELDTWLRVARSLTGGTRERGAVTEVPAVPLAARVLCAGLNYRLHAEEADLAIPERPGFFGRWTVSLVCGGTPVPIPPGEPGLDWEVELAAIVGRPLNRVDPRTALEGVFGYAAFNDLSCREHQMHSRLWTLGKNGDRSGPFSAIVTADEVGDPGSGLRMRTRVNGELMQDGTTADMIFSVGELLAYASEVMTLNPGDVVATGTPDGVGFKRTPARYLRNGDLVEIEVDAIESIANRIVSADDPGPG